MINENFKIRKAIEKDYFDINLLYYQTYTSYYKKIPESYKKTPKKILPKGTFLNMIEDKNALVIVACINEEVIGMLYATIETADDDEVTLGYNRVSVDEISVLPSFANKGVGMKLMEHAEEWAGERGIVDLTVLVYNFNKNAIAFYEKNGYKPYSIKLNKKIE